MARRPKTSEPRISRRSLKWARERASLSHSDVAAKLRRKRIDASTIEAWEDGQGEPTSAQIHDLARIFRVPGRWLYYEDPPTHFDDLGIVDFRTSKRSHLEHLSQNLRSAIEHALDIQAWVASYRAREHYERVELVDRMSTEDSAATVAEFLREFLDFEELREAAKDSKHLFDLFRQRLESHGILVLRMGQVANKTAWSLDPEEFKGFTIIDEDSIAPLIFVNRKDLDEAQIFTLVHELAHVVTGGSGLSNEDIINVDSDMPALERFCDAVAENLLAPESSFRRAWSRGKLEAVESDLKLSRIVAGRRAVTLGQASKRQFIRSVNDERNAPRKKAPGGNPYISYPAYYGGNLVQLMASAATSGDPSGFDALDLLGVKFGTAARLAEGSVKARKSKKFSNEKLPSMSKFPIIEIDDAWKHAGKR